MFCHGVFKKVFGGNQITNIFIWSMRLVVVLLNAMPVYLMNCEINEWLDNKTDVKMFKVLFNFLVAMTLLSYSVATLKRPKVIPQMAPPEQRNYCTQCRNWKPHRTHHCSICKICVPKMDHHCPWIGNCVGYHNFKAFFLFCVYQAVRIFFLSNNFMTVSRSSLRLLFDQIRLFQPRRYSRPHTQGKNLLLWNKFRFSANFFSSDSDVIQNFDPNLQQFDDIRNDGQQTDKVSLSRQLQNQK